VPREGAIIFCDIVGKLAVLRVECQGRMGRVGVRVDAVSLGFTRTIALEAGIASRWYCSRNRNELEARHDSSRAHTSGDRGRGWRI
jgi:hypothetical protein